MKKTNLKENTSKLEVGKLFPRIINCHCTGVFITLAELIS